MKKWEVYIAKVPFEDSPQSKIRPVLIMDDSVAVIDCLKMTGQPPRPGEYVLKEWAAAGLRKETTVRIDKRLSLPKENMLKKIGSLSLVDIAELQKCLE